MSMGHYWNDTDKKQLRYTGKKLPPQNKVWAIVELFNTDIYLHYIYRIFVPTSLKTQSFYNRKTS